jgi:hypothetical protein
LDIIHEKQCSKNAREGWALVLHARNPSYLGGRDQEDRGSRPALKIPNTHRHRHTQTQTHTHKVGWQSGSSGRAPA